MDKDLIPQEPDEQVLNDETVVKAPEDPIKPKPMWQQTKESWYDRIPLSLKQLNIIVGVCWTLLGICAILIILDAVGVF